MCLTLRFLIVLADFKNFLKIVTLFQKNLDYSCIGKLGFIEMLKSYI